MEQLTNMPMWIQLLSMGSFMFASGVLLTRIPLAPILILSFFYLYGNFNTVNSVPSFTLQHPWIITALHVVLPLLWIWIVGVGNSGGPADTRIGEVILVVLGLILLIVAGLVWACIKWHQFFTTVSVAKPVWVVALTCFIIGIIVGLVDWYFCFFCSYESWLPFLGLTILVLLLCAGSMCAIAYNKPGLLLVGLVLFIAAGTALESSNPLVKDQVYWKKRKIYDPLYNACKNGDLNEVKTWIAQNKGRNPDFVGYENMTPLFVAVREGHSEIVKELIAAGADVNQNYDNYWTLLRMARKNRNNEMAELLKSAGAKE